MILWVDTVCGSNASDEVCRMVIMSNTLAEYSSVHMHDLQHVLDKAVHLEFTLPRGVTRGVSPKILFQFMCSQRQSLLVSSQP